MVIVVGRADTAGKEQKWRERRSINRQAPVIHRSMHVKRSKIEGGREAAETHLRKCCPDVRVRNVRKATGGKPREEVHAVPLEKSNSRLFEKTVVSDRWTVVRKTDIACRTARS